MSITFSSSENNYWCFFFIIIATRRKRRTQRDSETRERNEEKRTFCDRKTDELRIVAGFIIRDRSDDAFGTTSEKKYSFTFYSIIARRREAEEEPIARARAPSFPSSLICDTKTKRETDELRSLALLSSAIVPTTPSERPQITSIFLHHRSTSRSRRRTHSARARAFFSFFSYLRYKNEKRDRRAQRHDSSFVIRDRSDDIFGTISD